MALLVGIGRIQETHMLVMLVWSMLVVKVRFRKSSAITIRVKPSPQCHQELSVAVAEVAESFNSLIRSGD